MSEPEWQDLQHSGIFDAVSPAWLDENNLTGGSHPERVRIPIVEHVARRTLTAWVVSIGVRSRAASFVKYMIFLPSVTIAM